MKVAIVGTSRLDTDELTRANEEIAKIIERCNIIGDTLITGDATGVDTLVACHSGEIDVEIIKTRNKHWAPHGYKDRNQKIAQKADYVYSIATKKIKDKRCYHCDEQNHDRTGGCWTKRYAMDKLHKDGETIII